mmetsp:Transcript_5585/g.12162  ORF Transcript_5585/g.12162 Transcript_5585/m.12162 type:complete len:378 (+) Transcript_5585:755-1888(+)
MDGEGRRLVVEEGVTEADGTAKGGARGRGLRGTFPILPICRRGFVHIPQIVRAGQIVLEQEELSRIAFQNLHSLPFLRLVIRQIVQFGRRHGCRGQPSLPMRIVLVVLRVPSSVHVAHQLALFVQQTAPSLLPNNGPKSRPLFQHFMLRHTFLRPKLGILIRLKVRQGFQFFQHDLLGCFVRRRRVPGVRFVPPKVPVVAEARVGSGGSTDHPPRPRPEDLRDRGRPQRLLDLLGRRQPQMALGLQFVHDALTRLPIQFLLGIPFFLREGQLSIPFQSSRLAFFDLLLGVGGRSHGLEAAALERLALQLGLLAGAPEPFAFALFGDFGKVLFSEGGDGAVVVGALVVVDVGEDAGVEFFIVVVGVFGLLWVGGHEPR